MKKRAIVTGGEKEQFPAMATLAVNIRGKCPNIADELVIFHNGVSQSEQERIQKIFPTRFIQYESPFATNAEKFTREVRHHFSFMLFCKYECWRLLEEYETVIWTDYDIVITHDITEIAARESTSCKFMNSRFLIRKFNANIDARIDELSDVDFIYGDNICGGLFVLFDNFPDYQGFYQDALRLTENLADTLVCAEEGVLSILLQRRKIHSDSLDYAVYCVNPKTQEVTEKAKILHTGGSLKFWNGFHNDAWENYYKIWTKEYGGMQMRRTSFHFKEVVRDLLPYGVVTRIL